jgi:hypothetical protein
MAKEMPKVTDSDGGGKDKDLLDFEIDKTHDNISEAGKSLNSALLAYFLLIGFTLLLIFSPKPAGPAEYPEVPFLGFKVSQPLAAALSLLLSFFVLYWLYSTLAMHALLIWKLAGLVEERYKQKAPVFWHLGYPSSFYSSFNSLAAFKSKVTGALIRLIGAVFFLVNHIIAFALTWRVTELLGLAGVWRLGLMAGCGVLLLPVLGFQIIFFWFSLKIENIKTSIMHLDETETERRKK